MMSIYAVTDVAAIVEEVVEGVYAGQVYKDFGSADIMDVSAGQTGKNSDRGLPAVTKSLLGGAVEQRNVKDVEVILDIEQGDYCFATQPGALRRVIMNIFGNSLKYTTRGKIVVRLRLDAPLSPADEHTKDKVLDITITDTGKGISSDYLRTSLYTAFSQEDVLANGTGLGLSIVRSIVSMLEGTIDIKSQLGQGTEVQVRIPLHREAGEDIPAATPSSVGSPDKLQENSISVLQKEHSSKRVSIYDPDNGELTVELDTETGRVASYYVQKWFNMAVPPCSLQEPTEVIVVEERGLPDLLCRLRPGPAIVVLCGKTHRLQAAQSLYTGAIEFMSTPFGPYKLAKAIRLSLEKAEGVAAGLAPQPGPVIQTVNSPGASDTSILPEFASMTLETKDETTPVVQVRTNGVLTASQSNNAKMALATGSSGASAESRGDFPFPTQSPNPSGSDSPHSAFGEMMRQYSSNRPKLTSRSTEPLIRPLSTYTSALSRQGVLATSNARKTADQDTTAAPLPEPEPSETKTPETAAPKSNADPEKRPPRLLLVDDNNINLRLLETFMRKRKYKSVDSASDGNQAVEAARKHEQGYDIIFMVSSFQLGGPLFPLPPTNGFRISPCPS